ncbi:ricin-type beta-trefoil lectin domain protein [Kitasatospora sp. MAP5-34]|uniref:ricin-type beta-trefoil lectin domain protein n=1 Tax=Kitasatospora sp. MAP5-34 TaxID=3035102 RepID=UPI002476897C|nr:ricin-type beta-trefoil lectin domain protein [Kitasatospora sp. MAP5-34]MDH6577804.1 beta-glucanase (GH16 family) [Kitasatospora sp. MAP5-34]
MTSGTRTTRTPKGVRSLLRGCRPLVVSSAAALLALFVTFPAPAGAVAVPGPPSGWTTVFSDDFSGAAGSAPSSSNWVYDTGPGSNFGTGEIETMTDSTANVHLDGSGHLDITALSTGGSWTSGRIRTPNAAVGAPAGGKLEVTASIQQPDPGSGQGYWPAFWMLGPGQWPENGEIDIMEDVNALSQVAGTIHCGTSPGGVCNESNGIGSGLRACSGCQAGFHTYAMILDRTKTSAESITWYLDGTQYFSVSESQVGAAAWQQAFDHNLSIIFDLAVGGGFPNGVCGCTTPNGSTSSGGTMSVGYVAAYTTTGGSAPGAGAITGYGGLCLDDRSAGTANYNPIQVYTCNGTSAQDWSFVQAGTTLHVLGKCLDVYAAGTANGTAVDLYDCNNTGSQVWIPRSDGSLYNPQSNKCLDDTGWSTTPGTQAEIWDCTGGANQKWTLPA